MNFLDLPIEIIQLIFNLSKEYKLLLCNKYLENKLKLETLDVINFHNYKYSKRRINEIKELSC